MTQTRSGPALREWWRSVGKLALQAIEPGRQAVEAAKEADRLAAANRTIDGVAHDFNNLLTVITAITEHLADMAEEGSEQQQLARDGMMAAGRGAELVHRLLASSRKAGRTPQTLDCNEVVDEIAALMRYALAPNIQLTRAETGAPLTCLADRTDLISALMNLCANAGDAMADGGHLSLTAEFALLSTRAAEPLGLEPGRYVIFDVADTGTGMAPDVLAKATEAFFTTKGAAGTGLGLAESAQFARESGGALSIRSRQGQGTTVSLYLPGVGATPQVLRLKAQS